MKFATVGLAIALALGVAACASSSTTGSSSAASGSTLTVADVAPFSGPDAALGPTYLATCYGATTAINNAGGVGFARTPPVWMHPGDVIEVTVEGVGTIRNRIVTEAGAPGDWRWHPGAPR